MSIEVVFSDLDGCLLPKDYDPSGVEQSHLPSERYFEYYRSYPGPQIVVCTGRSWEATRGIMTRVSHFPSEARVLPVKPVICENGARIVLDSRKGEEVSLIESFRCDSDPRILVREIHDLRKTVVNRSDLIKREVERRLNKPVGQLHFPPKKYMVTADVPFYQSNEERVPQRVFLEVLLQFLPISVRDLLEKNQLIVSCSRNAVDVHLPIGKSDGVRFLIEKYGLERTKIAYIGDAESDIEALTYAQVGCCPANADDSVKKHVRRKGAFGYVSPFLYAEGAIDSLKWITSRFYPRSG